ncbi:hypothetical protein FRACYDRAFT_238524 [Fragilariopsis cylindrus CCMP1102]|uniref:Uncharacterized protein n=1 Tax=Fragilariopsis cylindrus CCMP1102 TaxID=635003 RepID=A0A1E7FIT7_9STRA|nr:hypothetical protein FRACYDRAFT_238524 [Fragilariopsis cylindrus CCMP1102]|eukprot:OEU18090.1 hypothetical protein FRACYDRAFT_238524 [Fragilariopsis cylindrus CCMP1102]
MITSSLYLARRRNTSSIINTATRRSTSTSTSSSSSSSASTDNGHVHEIKSRILPNIHPLQLFRIIQDVDSYIEFLPLCYKSKVYTDSIRNGGRQFNAELVVGFGNSGSSSNFLFGSGSPLFKTRYISQVIVNPNELTIETISDGSINNNSNNDNDDDDNHQRFFDSLTSSWKLRPYYNKNNNNDNDDNNDIENNDDRAAINNNNNVKNNIGGTIVDFKVEMIGISNPIIKSLLNSVLYNVAETQVTAFETRCRQQLNNTDPPFSNQDLLLANKFYKL